MTPESVRKPCPNTRHSPIHLGLKEFYTKPYKCCGCNMIGVGPRYGCPKCDYIELHRECWSPTPSKTMPFLQGHVFAFRTCLPEPQSKPGCTCDACGMQVVGFNYRCDKDDHGLNVDLDLHPRCAMLENKLTIDRVEFSLNINMKKNKKCEFCDSSRLPGGENEDVPGWWYVSSEGHYFHVFCIMNWAVEKWQSWSSEVIKDVNNQDVLAWVKFELRPLVKNKKKNSTNSKKYWKLLRTLVTTIISVIFGDPTTILANLAVNTAVTVVQHLCQD